MCCEQDFTIEVSTPAATTSPYETQLLTMLARRRTCKVVINFGPTPSTGELCGNDVFQRWLSGCRLLFVHLPVCLSVCLSVTTNEVNTRCNGCYKSLEQRSLQPRAAQQRLRRPLHRVFTYFARFKTKIRASLIRSSAVCRSRKPLQVSVSTR